MGRRPFKPRKSKLDAFADIVGVEPDSVVAEKAKVSAETVRTYRVRRGVPAGWRGEKAPAGSAVNGQATHSSTRVRKRAFRGRRSRLDPYKDELGATPDSEVAAKAGVTVENVRSYRRRRGIPAAWKDVGNGTAAVRPRGSARRGQTARGKDDRWAYRVTARLGSENREFVVFGESLSDAAVQAERRLAERLPRARLLEVAALAEAL